MSIYLGASAASRWFYCTASPGYLEREKDKIERRTYDYAEEGIEAHKHAGDALQVAGMYDWEDVTDVSMAGHVKAYVDYCLERAGSDKLIVETRVPLFYMPTRNGIVDVAIIGAGRMEINDLKYGQGVAVDAVQNLQMAIYARSFIEKLKDDSILDHLETVTMTIYQPRIREGDTIKTWTIPLKDLIEFTDKINDVAKSILANPDGGTFYPSDKTCQFCDAKSFCTARTRSLLGELPEDTPIEAIVPAKPVKVGLAFPAIDSLSVEQLAKISVVAKDMKSWLDEVLEYGKSRLESGKEFPGFKLVQGKSHRKWIDEAEAGRVLRQKLEKDEVYPASLISPSQAEKLLKDKDLSTRYENLFASLIVKPPGGPTMVPIDDPRPAIEEATSVFENLENTSDLL